MKLDIVIHKMIKTTNKVLNILNILNQKAQNNLNISHCKGDIHLKHLHISPHKTNKQTMKCRKNKLKDKDNKLRHLRRNRYYMITNITLEIIMILCLSEKNLFLFIKYLPSCRKRGNLQEMQSADVPARQSSQTEWHF